MTAARDYTWRRADRETHGPESPTRPTDASSELARVRAHRSSEQVALAGRPGVRIIMCSLQGQPHSWQRLSDGAAGIAS